MDKPTVAQKRRIEQLEANVDNAIAARLLAGESLREIKEAELYRYFADTWEDYLVLRWPKTITKRHADRLISAVNARDSVKGLVIQSGPTGSHALIENKGVTSTNDKPGKIFEPKKVEIGKDVELNERCLRQLAPLEESQRADVLAEAVKIDSKGNPRVTAKSISDAAKKMYPPEPDPEEESDEEEFEEEYDAQAVMTDRNRELESFCRSVLKFWKDNRPTDNPWIAHKGTWQSASDALDSALRTLRLAKAKHLCPECEGHDECELCLGTGFMTDQEFKTRGL